MKPSTLLSCVFALWGAGLSAKADLLRLRYEWSATPHGPYTRLAPSDIRVDADGSATVVTNGTRGFFQLLFDDAAAPGGGGTVPVTPYSALPELQQSVVRRLAESIAAEDSEEGRNWKNLKIAPFGIPVTSAWNNTGIPDMLELKITGDPAAAAPADLFRSKEGLPTGLDRGFILVSLSRKNPPIVGYATEGLTPCEQLLKICEAGPVHCIRRFGPAFLAAERQNKTLLGNRGLFPAIYSDADYVVHSAPQSYAWTSGANNPRFPDRPTPAVPRTFSSFAQLLDAYQNSVFLTERRKQRQELIEFEWKALEGTAPVLDVVVGNRENLLPGETFTSFSIDDEDSPRGAEVTLRGAGGGISIIGNTPGLYTLTLRPAGNNPVRYLVRVRSGAPSPRGGGGFTQFTTTKLWTAGTTSQQPWYGQRSDLNEWCDAVGCGPVMMALQVAWLEHNKNVPSAFWNRSPNASLNSRRESLRTVDSPMEYWDDSHFSTSMFHFYDYLHEACDVACWANGAGSTIPWDLGDVMGNYVDYLCSSFLPLQVIGDTGGPLCSGSWAWENDAWGDDWDEAGIRVANAIKAGRPAGVYYMEHWHYCMAFRYRKTTYGVKDANGAVFASATARSFRVNTGWGEDTAVWNAYDIDGCFLMNLNQVRQLAPP